MMYSAHTTQTPPERGREGGRERERKGEKREGRRREGGRENMQYMVQQTQSDMYSEHYTYIQHNAMPFIHYTIQQASGVSDNTSLYCHLKTTYACVQKHLKATDIHM